MTVKELTERPEFEALALPVPDREITGGFAGDMPSWVMGRADAGDAWMTILNNRNIVAVAVMADLSCIIVADGSEVPEEVIELAGEQEVNILGSEKGVFELSAELAGLI